jgi:peptide deformylase
MIKEIVKFGHPVLRVKAKEILKLSDDIKSIIQDLIETVDADPNGVGLCGPQLNYPLRLMGIHQERSHEVMQALLKNENESHKPVPFSEDQKVTIYINPKILSFSEDHWIYPEGCLSIPKLFGDVERPWEIKIEALDENFKSFKKTLTGYEARVFMHENDHLNGVLFIDRVSKQERKSMDIPLKAIKKQFKEFNSKYN